jgi:hypothetical protein
MIVFEVTQSLQCLKVKGLIATQSLHRCKVDGFGQKMAISQIFLMGIKQQNSFLDSFLEEERIGVARIDFFSDSRPPLVVTCPTDVLANFPKEQSVHCVERSDPKGLSTF